MFEGNKWGLCKSNPGVGCLNMSSIGPGEPLGILKADGDWFHTAFKWNILPVDHLSNVYQYVVSLSFGDRCRLNNLSEFLFPILPRA